MGAASITREDLHVGPADQRLYLLRKNGGAGACPVLFLHGSTLPGSLIFDLAFDGTSWIDDLAASGRDCWSLDLRGYGRSWQPLPATGEGEVEASVSDTTDALQDVSAAVDYIRQTTGSDTVDLIGWSWGATVMGAYAARPDTPVRRLVLHAPQWVRDTPSPMVNDVTMTRAYREVDPARFKDRWIMGLGADAVDDVRQRGWIDIVDQALASTAAGPIRVPNGSVRDIANHWMANDPLYDPGAIEAPTLVIVGSEDRDTPPAIARAVYDRLRTADRAYQILAGATHFALMEPPRAELFRIVREFLAK